MKNAITEPSFSSVLQDFFYQRLINQMNASPKTIASYRDTFRLLLQYAVGRLGQPPVAINWNDLDAPLVLDFLDHLEKERGNSARTRNARLAPICSFMQYAALRNPTVLALAHRIRAIPQKRFQRKVVGFLSREEMNAVIDAPDSSTWSGQRDRVMFATFYNTGARVSEVIGMRVEDVSLGQSSHIRIHGKGRKERIVPLWKNTALQLKGWINRIATKREAALFQNRQGQALTRSGIENRLREAVKSAAQLHPTLLQQAISPHVLRHTTAMHLLQSGVDLSVIALWLGHESSSTTHIYMEADLSMKERALNKIQEPASRFPRFRPTDKILQFLEGL